MLSDDQIERLIVSLEANTDKFDKALAGNSARLDKVLGQMERRADDFSAKIDKAMASAGAGFRRVMEGIGIGLSFEGLKHFVESVTETAMNVKKQAAAIGVSASTFQAWSIMAQKADVDQSVFNSTLERMTANIGKAQLKTTDFGRTLSRVLKMPYQAALAGSPEDVIYRIADAMKKIGPVSQRAEFLRMASGGTGGGGSGGGVALAQFFGQGSGAMKSQVHQLIANGEVMSDETVEKIQRLDKAWIDIKATLETGGASLLTGFVDGFQQLSGVVTDEKFQNGLREIGKLIGEITHAIGTVANSTGHSIRGLARWMGEYIYVPGQQHEVDTLKRMGADPKRIKEAEARLAQYQSRLTMLRNEDHITPYAADYGDGTGRYIVSDARGKKPEPPGLNLKDSLNQGAYAKAVEALRLRTQALRDGAGEFANYTAAQESARVKVELTTAAEAEAASKNAKVTRAQRGEIEKLSQAYGDLYAAKKFAQDLNEENDHIDQLKAEAAAAGATARQLAELETRERLLARFRADKGPGKTPGPDDMARINAAAALHGDAAAGAEWAKTVDSAQKEIAAAQARNGEIGQYGPDLAVAQMRARLVNAGKAAGKIQNGQPIDPEVQATITRLSTEYGALAQATYTATEAFDRQLSMTSELRDGLTNIATAGLHGFNSMKSAASSFIDQLAAMVLKLYVLQPLMDKAFGPVGTAGGGSAGGFLTDLLGGKGGTPGAGIGTFFASLFNFADGGVMTPGGPRKLKRFAGGGVSSSAAIFGEAGVEAAVPLPDGRSIPVSLRTAPTPRIPQLPAPSNTVNYSPVIQVTGTDKNAVAQMRALLNDHMQNMPAVIHQTVTQMARRKSGPWN